MEAWCAELGGWTMERFSERVREREGRGVRAKEVVSSERRSWIFEAAEAAWASSWGLVEGGTVA